MDLKFRYLKPDEVECRVATVSDKGCSLLLYKDARCDQIILDNTESVGAMNWEKSYDLIDGQLFCTIRIWDKDKKMWISKQDVGVESYTEAEKGRASDAQKRSAFAWGIGRELYTAPFIWIGTDGVNISDKGDKSGKKTTYDKFEVKEMEVEDGKITALKIVNTSKPFYGKVVFDMKNPKSVDSPKSSSDNKAETTSEVEKKFIDAVKVNTLTNKAKTDGVPLEKICEKCKVKSLDKLTEKQFAWICSCWTKTFVNGE